MKNPFEIIENRLSCIESLILELKHLPQGAEPKEPKDEWFSLDKLVEYDPAKRVKATWYSMVSRGEVPYHKSGKHLVFLKSEIDEWLKSSKRNSNADIVALADSYLLNKKRA
jgi:excisionase family DNA binding protein